MKKLWEFIRPYRFYMFLAILLKASGAVMDLLLPYFMGVLIDSGIGVNNTDVIWKMIIAMSITTIMTVVLNALAHYYAAKYSMLTGESVRNKLYLKIQKLKIESIDHIESSSLITRVTNDVENIQSSLEMMVRPLVRGPMIVITGLVMSFATDVKLTLIILVGMVAVAFASLSVYKVTKPLFRATQRSIDKLTLILSENLNGIRLIKSYDKQSFEQNRFMDQTYSVKKNESKAAKYHGFIQPGISCIANVILAIAMFSGGYRVQSGELKIGAVITISNYITQILMATNMIPRMLMMLSRANISASRISEVLEMNECDEYGTEEKSENKDTILEFRNVTFTYPGSKEPSLKNISFKINKGETIGITGDTGCGKSTLLNLILRLYDPQEGEIIFEGKNIKEYNKDFLRKHISAAMQQFNIFQNSILENIILDKNNNEKQLEKAINTAQINDLVSARSSHLKYDITQRGTNLSGGQKQRISIARALYKQADLTIFDDVSSGLDYHTDLLLRRAIRKNYSGSTVIIIAQRISSIIQCDVLIILDNGCICGAGSHDDLINSCPKYQEIYYTQEGSQNGDVSVEE